MCLISTHLISTKQASPLHSYYQLYGLISTVLWVSSEVPEHRTHMCGLGLALLAPSDHSVTVILEHTMMELFYACLCQLATQITTPVVFLFKI